MQELSKLLSFQMLGTLAMVPQPLVVAFVYVLYDSALRRKILKTILPIKSILNYGRQKPGRQ